MEEHSSNDALRRMDITERCQAEEVQARLAAIVESSEDAIFAMSLDGTIHTWNAGAQALFSYTPALDARAGEPPGPCRPISAVFLSWAVEKRARKPSIEVGGILA